MLQNVECIACESPNVYFEHASPEIALYHAAAVTLQQPRLGWVVLLMKIKISILL